MKKKILLIGSGALALLLVACASVAFDDGPATISKIQGLYHRSLYEGRMVEKVEGVVTAIQKSKYDNGFYMQSKTPDNDARTSEGLYVDNACGVEVSVGAIVSVSGTVKEMQFPKPKEGQLTVTAIEATTIEMLEGTAEIKPVVIDSSRIPEAIHRGSISRKLKIKRNAMDFYEALEGMLVSVLDPVVVGAKEKYGEIAIVGAKGAYAENRSNNGGVRYTYGYEQTQRLMVDDVFFPLVSKGRFTDAGFTPNPGDTFAGVIEGILTFSYSNYTIFNTKPLPALKDSGAKVDSPRFAADKNAISIASYNIENFTIADGPKRVKALAKHVTTYLNTPDIIGLVEVGDDNGGVKENIELVSAEKTLQAIVDGIKQESGVEYKFLSVDPENGKDGGWPAMHIRNAILYRTDRVSVPYFKQGDAKVDTVLQDGKLSFNPGRIGNTDVSFEGVRKPVVAHVQILGKDVFVIVNHLKSKRSDGKLYGALRPVVRHSEEKRIPEGKFVGAFLKTLHSAYPKALLISMGDMNDFEFSPTMTAMKGSIMVNTVEMLPEAERHTYVYKGNSQVLDGLLINKEYKDATQVDILNINSEFTAVQGAFSDHDPILVQVKVK